MWEDPRNINGGRWLVTVEKAKGKDKVDEYWLDLLIAMLGEQFDELGDLVCGAVVNIRQKGDKVEISGLLKLDNQLFRSRSGLAIRHKMRRT